MNNSEIILSWRVSKSINRKCVFDRQKMWPDFVAQSNARLAGDQELRVRCLSVQLGNRCLLHIIFSPETNTGYLNIFIDLYWMQ